MPVLRRCGGSVSIRLSPKRISPALRSAKPAIVRNSVVLPQPDGPSSVKNSPSAISSETSSTARTVPNERDTWSIEIAVKMPPEQTTHPHNRGGRPYRHCEERSDEAIQFSLVASGLLHFARNDGVPSACLLDQVLDAIHGFAALCDPAVLVVFHELDVGELRHFARQVGQ